MSMLQRQWLRLDSDPYVGWDILTLYPIIPLAM